MPHDFDTKTKRFIDPKGRAIPRREVRGLIDKLTDTVASDAKRIAAAYEKHGNAARFEIEMRGLLKSAHIAAASVGRGGRARMTQADWGKVGNRLKGEYGYLAKFVRKIGSGSVQKVASRAQRYSSSVVMSYHETMRTEETQGTSGVQVRLLTNSEEGCPECAADEARGWVGVNDMDELGTRICGNFCKCDLEFSDDVDD